MNRHIKEEQLWDYIDQNISEEDHNKIELHLASCIDCQGLYQSQLQMHQLLHEQEHELPSIDFSKIVSARVNKSLALDRSLRFWQNFMIIAIMISFGMSTLFSILVFVEKANQLSLNYSNLNYYSYALLFACLLLWAFYGLDRLCRKIFRHPL